MEALNRYMLRSHLLDLGERGELVARALITEAYDRAVSKERAPLAMGCRLIDWAQELFRDHKTLEAWLPSNITADAQKFKDAFADARIRILQWVRAYDDHELCTDAMAPAFIRGFAFICRRGETAVDLVIPVALSSKENIGERNMTSVLVQVKLRKRTGHYDINADSFHPPFFPASISDAKTPMRAYVTIIMELGTQKPRPHAPIIGVLRGLADRLASVVPVSEDPAPTEPKHTKSPPATLITSIPPSRWKTPRTPYDIHARYDIRAIGCSHDTYAVIESADLPLYTALLGQDDLIFDHPRPKIAPVLNMKPDWRLESYAWYDQPSPSST